MSFVQLTSAGPSAAPINQWIKFYRTDSNVRLRLFCFSHAGGSARLFRHWPHMLPADIQVCTVELPGRHTRLLEPPCTNLPELMDALSQVLVPWLDIPFAFFGHSMGALIAFELARKLRRGNNPGPQQLLVASRPAPQKSRRQAAIYDLPEPEFIEALHSRYNIPLTALDHGELMQLMMPMLRADFAICDTYEYLPEEPLNIQINAYGGLADREVTREEMEAWENQTNNTFMLKMFPGDHFFLDSSPSLVTKAISDALEPPRGSNQLYPGFPGQDIG